jgi:catechol 2,3-dioxygenase-like lactoylglutathione lyase family enzyme
MLGDCAIIAFVATQQPERAKAFYSKVLGLRLASNTSFALVFDARGTMLRVVKVHALTPAPHTVLGWKVPDIRRRADSSHIGRGAFPVVLIRGVSARYRRCEAN